MIDLLKSGAGEGLGAVVFDLDGTLYESRPFGREILRIATEVIGEILGVNPVVADALIRETKRKISADTGIETSLTVACRELGADIREMHRRFAAELAPERYLKNDPRVVDLLDRLSSRYELHLYTNNNLSLTGRILETIGCRQFFPRPFTIEEGWEPKPHPATLEALLREIRREPGECLFVGDRYDIDLSLPAERGCRVFLSRTVEELLQLNELITEE
jgi:putative hydrolase of the HAD superfamily